MHLFTRTLPLTGSPRGSMAWATDITQHVNAASDKTVTCWSVSFGEPVGTTVWSTWVDGVADLESSFGGLIADDAYHALLERGAEFLGGPAVDMLRLALYGEPAGDPPPIGSVTTMTTATTANGKYEEAMKWGAEMAAHVESVTSLPTFFLADEFGPFGQVTWLSGAPDAAAADAGRAAINTDLDYLKRLADVGDLFVPGSGRQAMGTRIA